MRNRNWNQDFDEINQSNVNRFHTNRDGERQYDSGYSNPYGPTSFEQQMNRQNNQRYQNWNNQPDHNQNRYYNQQGNYNQPMRGRYNEPQQYGRQNQQEQGFFGNVGDRLGEFVNDGRERVEQFFDRFGNRTDGMGNVIREGWNQVRHTFGRFGNEEQRHHQERQYPQQSGQYNQNRNNQHADWHNPDIRRGYHNTPYHPENQGQVQGHRYDRDDYSGRSSYRLLDTYSGYGQSGLSYASDRDDE